MFVQGSGPDDEVGVTLDVRLLSFPGRMTGPGDPLGLCFTEVLSLDRPVALLDLAQKRTGTSRPSLVRF